MFKLQQMKKVDLDVVNRLIDHFEEMDFDDTRMLVIGLHIPNEKQAAEMKREIKGTNISLIDAWKIKREKIMKDLGFDDNNRLRSSTISPMSGRHSTQRNNHPSISYRASQDVENGGVSSPPNTSNSSYTTELTEIKRVLKDDNKSIKSNQSEV